MSFEMNDLTKPWERIRMRLKQMKGLNNDVKNLRIFEKSV